MPSAIRNYHQPDTIIICCICQGLVVNPLMPSASDDKVFVPVNVHPAYMHASHYMKVINAWGSGSLCAASPALHICLSFISNISCFCNAQCHFHLRQLLHTLSALTRDNSADIYWL